MKTRHDRSLSDQDQSRGSRPSGVIALILSIAVVVGALATTGRVVARADDVVEAPTPTSIPVPPTAEPDIATTPEPTATEESTPVQPEPTPTPGDPPRAAAEPSLAPEPSATVTTEALPEAAPTIGQSPTRAATLTIVSEPTPRCLPIEQSPDVIAHGGYLDYACMHDVQVTGDGFAAAAVSLEWTVQAIVTGDWSIQLLPPSVETAAIAEWTGGGSFAEFAYRGAIPGEHGDGAAAFDMTRLLAFGLRVHRAVCGADAQTVEVVVAVAPVAPANDEAVVTADGQPEPLLLRPALAPIPEPTLSLSGSLDFGVIGATVEGPLVQPEPQELLVAVGNVDRACGAYDLALAAGRFSGSSELETTAPTLLLTSINGEPLSGRGCPLQEGCTITTFNAGPEMEHSAAYVLGVSLVLPEIPRVAAFSSTLTASVMRVRPSTDQADTG